MSDKSNILISVVIPVYNVEDYIDDCLNSILNQIENIEDAVEIILIDDGSIDSSGMICDRYHYNYPKIIKVYHKDNEGLLLTRRYGYKFAEGEYILNCDSDDMLMEGAILKIINIIKSQQPSVIIYNMKTFGEKYPCETFFESIFGKEQLVRVNKKRVYEEMLSSFSIVSMCCKCFTKECLDINFNYDKFAKVGNGEDTLQSLEIFTRAQSILYLNEFIYLYRRSTGMSAKFDDKYYYSFKEVIKRFEEYKNIWNISDFDILLAIKYFNCLGRSITQSQRATYNFSDHIYHLQTIRNDDYVIKYEKYFAKIKNRLSRNYRILDWLLLKKKYNFIFLLLKIKKNYKK